MQTVITAFLDEFSKIALNRLQKEYGATQDPSLLKGFAEMSPKHLRDVSGGGIEAGVSQMGGNPLRTLANPLQPQVHRAIQQGQAPAPGQAAAHAEFQAARGPQAGPNLQQRFGAYQQNKAQMGLAGKAPAPAVMQNPQARGLLLQGQPQAPAPSPTTGSGTFAEKYYKPDSPIVDRANPANIKAHLDQKMRATTTARGLSPEAAQIMPAMHGFQERMTPQGPRYKSQHEWVGGLKEMTDAQTPEADAAMKHVIQPMRARGMPLEDTMVELPGGKTRWMNPGNVVNSDAGPKVVDFMPHMPGEPQYAQEALTARAAHLKATGQPGIDAHTYSQYRKLQDVPSLRQEVVGRTERAAGKVLPRAEAGVVRAAASGVSHKPGVVAGALKAAPKLLKAI